MTALAYRPATDADRVFVLDSFVDSYRTAHAAGLIAMDDWREVMWGQCVKLLRRPGVRVIVAHRPDEERGAADLYGWLAVEDGTPPLVHYCYVKRPYRRFGLARGMLKHAGLELDGVWHYSAKTSVVSKLRDKIPRAKWNPLRARFPPRDLTPVGEDNVQER